VKVTSQGNNVHPTAVSSSKPTLDDCTQLIVNLETNSKLKNFSRTNHESHFIEFKDTCNVLSQNLNALIIHLTEEAAQLALRFLSGAPIPGTKYLLYIFQAMIDTKKLGNPGTQVATHPIRGAMRNALPEYGQAWGSN